MWCQQALRGWRAPSLFHVLATWQSKPPVQSGAATLVSASWPEDGIHNSSLFHNSTFQKGSFAVLLWDIILFSITKAKTGNYDSGQRLAIRGYPRPLIKLGVKCRRVSKACDNCNLDSPKTNYKKNLPNYRQYQITLVIRYPDKLLMMHT